MYCPWCWENPCACTAELKAERKTWDDDKYYAASLAAWQRASERIELLEWTFKGQDDRIIAQQTEIERLRATLGWILKTVDVDRYAVMEIRDRITQVLNG